MKTYSYSLKQIYTNIINVEVCVWMFIILNHAKTDENGFEWNLTNSLLY